MTDALNSEPQEVVVETTIAARATDPISIRFWKRRWRKSW